MSKETGISRADIDVSKWPSLDEIIAHLAWEVEQPNSHPLCLYEPLILAIGRRLAKSRHGGAEKHTLQVLALPDSKGEVVS
jgi:hypothetical protein